MKIKNKLIKLILKKIKFRILKSKPGNNIVNTYR